MDDNSKTGTPDNTLYCVACGGECLHPEAVYIIARGDSGDVLNVIAISVQDRGPAERTFPDAALVEQIHESVSSRGTVIGRLYSCEFCPATSIFTERFHKGTTYFAGLVAS